MNSKDDAGDEATGPSGGHRRHDFTPDVRRRLAQRAGYICSNPDCRLHTTGPGLSDSHQVVARADASHITAASPGGPRYDPTLSAADRSSIDNGIWLCANCARLIDQNHGADHSTELLRAWKALREAEQAQAVRTGSVPRGVPAPTGAPKRELPWFEWTGGSWGSDSRKIGPSWTIRKKRGDEVERIQYRFRSRYHQEDWRTVLEQHLSGTSLSTEINYSVEPSNPDPDVGIDEIGLEIRCLTDRGWRHELHVWALTRKAIDNPPRVHLDFDAREERGPKVWYPPDDGLS